MQIEALEGVRNVLAGEPGAGEPLRKALMSEPSFPLVQLVALFAASLVATEEGRLAQARELASKMLAKGDQSTAWGQTCFSKTIGDFAS